MTCIADGRARHTSLVAFLHHLRRSRHDDRRTDDRRVAPSVNHTAIDTGPIVEGRQLGVPALGLPRCGSGIRPLADQRRLAS